MPREYLRIYLRRYIMSILVQLLIIILVLALFYAVVIHNREDIKKVVDLLPDFSKIRFGHQAAHAPEPSALVKVIVFVPDAHAEAVRLAIGEPSFSSQGIGRFGESGEAKILEEERIEVTIPRQNLSKVVDSIKRSHPDHDPEIDILPVEAVPGQEPIHTH